MKLNTLILFVIMLTGCGGHLAATPPEQPQEEPRPSAYVLQRGAPLFQRIGGGAYQLIMDLDVKNTGNVELSGLEVRISSFPVGISDLREVPGTVKPDETVLLFAATPLVLQKIVAGQVYTVKLTLASGNVVFDELLLFLVAPQ